MYPVNNFVKFWDLTFHPGYKHFSSRWFVDCLDNYSFRVYYLSSRSYEAMHLKPSAQGNGFV
jgi:hypothetical protein